jgi:hypothetical protein
MKIRWRIRFLFWWYLNFRYDIKNEELFEIKKTGNGIKKLLFFLPLEKSDAQLANYFTKTPTKENNIIRNYFVHEKALAHYSDQILKDSIIYNDDDFNWLGIIKTSSIINQINKKEYDALVDLNPGDERLISLACLKLKIPIKIGFQSPLADNLYTLIVQATENSFVEKHYKMIENLLSLNQE